MTTRSNGPVLTDQRERIEEAKLEALKQAAIQGWSDITAGRYTEGADDRIEDFVAQLGALQAPAKYLEADASTKSIPTEP